MADCLLFAPARLCELAGKDGGAAPIPFARFAEAMARDFHQFRGHVIIGAAGIAVRALAPLLRHKSGDPPVVVLDAGGRFAVSLLSGHWGGGNSLARHVARLLGGEAVITTASDAVSGGPPALDELARAAGLRILDWDKLPRVAAALLEGWPVPLSDPLSCLPVAREPRFLRGAEKAGGDIPLVRIHWRLMPPEPGLLRMAPPLLHAGVGCRRGVDAASIVSAVRETLAGHGLETAALASLATVAEKAGEPGLRDAARRLGVPLLAYPAPQLAAMPVPHPSVAAGARFGLPPFSVCEGAALLAAQEARPHGRALLLAPKTVFQGRITVAVAVCQGEK
ncbi:cobalamin biosynthesis protein [Desulfovibrio sp.]|uniref:cobalt-precorrin 5A hydrolase n=1 Tax=Desulfovibrio sp. TaxID=885 RepID=UPI00260D5020|nr:cobalamin biosynthesis protein [Desulfovibrio sp.]